MRRGPAPRIPVILAAALVALTAGGAPALRAAPADDAIIAAMRLAEEPGYAWITTVTDDARTYTIRGETTRDGYSRVSMPVINSLRRHLGRDVTDTDIELIFRGNVDCVVATDDGWRTPAEVMSQRRGDEPRSPRPPPAKTTAAAAGSTAHATPSASIHTDAAGLNLGLGLPADRDPSGVRTRRLPYSNLQLALSRPHDELGIIVSSHATLTVDDDVVSGTLSDLGARLLLVREGQAALTPQRASGTFRLWLRAGRVVRYALKLEGVIDVTSSAGARQIQVNQSSDTVIRSVGAIAVEIPAAARERLGG